MRSNGYFPTKEAAQAYKEKKGWKVEVPILTSRGWVLAFDIKGHLEVVPHQFDTYTRKGRYE